MPTYGGSSGNDTLGGSSGADTINGYGGNDSLSALAGNDSVRGGNGADTIYGGAGVDTLYGDAGADLIYGGDDQADLVYGGADNDTIHGGSEVGGEIDTLHGDGGDDLVYGGDGAGNVIYGGLGRDSLYGGTGNDTVQGGAGDDYAELGGGDDTFGDWDTDDGNDTVHGGAGNDSINGGDGDDQLYGGDGDDTLIGAAGNDSVYGGAGNDVAGINDDHHGGYFDLGENAGDFDQIWFSNYLTTNGIAITFTANDAGTYGFGAGYASGSFAGVEAFTGTVYGDTIDAAADTDGIWIDGFVGDDSLTGGSGADTLHGSDGNDTITGGAGADTLSGEAGNDSLVGDTGDDSLDGGTGHDSLYGGSGNDTVSGGAGDDHVELGDGDDSFGDWGTDDGNDTVLGGAGNDSINGGDGDDQLYGGDGDDTLIGASGNDSVYGGAGNDLAHIHDDHEGGFLDLGEDAGDWDRLQFFPYLTANGISVTFSGNDAGSYSFGAGYADGSFTGVEAITGTGYGDTIDAAADTDGVWIDGQGGDDLITGGSGDDELHGGDGHDVISGGAGADYIEGGEGDDLLLGGDGADTLSGGGGQNDIRGEAGNDSILGGDDGAQLFGGDGDDTISGGAGRDRLTGGQGNDLLSGGSGQDTLVFGGGDGADTVTDFDLTLIDGRTADQFDVSELVNPSGAPILWGDFTVTDDGGGNAVLTFPLGESITLLGIAPDRVDKQTAGRMGLPCFAAGTLIDTPAGRRPVEDLRRGDRVLTPEGALPVLWAGGRRLGPADMAQRPDYQPVMIRQGVLGNDRPLVLSRQHSVVVEGPSGPVLARAAQLAGLGRGAFRQAKGRRSISYHHVLLARHALVRANGAWVETLWPGPAAIAALGPAAGGEIAAALPALAPALAVPSLLPAVFGPRALPPIPSRLLRGLPEIRPARTCALQGGAQRELSPAPRRA